MSDDLSADDLRRLLNLPAFQHPRETKPKALTGIGEALGWLAVAVLALGLLALAATFLRVIL